MKTRIIEASSVQGLVAQLSMEKCFQKEKEQPSVKPVTTLSSLDLLIARVACLLGNILEAVSRSKIKLLEKKLLAKFIVAQIDMITYANTQ
jgi:hypothetical protein